MSTIRLRTEIPGPKSRQWMQRYRASVPRGVYTVTPVFIASGKGVQIEDLDGNRFLDFAGGLGCLNAGQRPEAVEEAVQRQSRRFLHACVHVTPYDAYVRLAEALNRRTPGDFPKKTMLANSGAEAVENAVKVARAHTGRPGIICFEDAFHGRTLLGLSLTSKTHPYKSGFGPFAPEIYRMPYAYCYRCSYHLSHPECELHCARQLENVFSRVVAEESVAAVLLEPVLGEGGFVVPPSDFFPVLAAECRKRGVLIIADEVQTGYGRTGTLFACEQFDLEPDIIVTGKSMGAGLPLSSITGRREIMDAPDVGGLGGTFGGNPVACEAALALLETFDSNDLAGRARQIGQLFHQRALGWKDAFPIIGEIRGMGAMQALELVTDRRARWPAAKETRAVIDGCCRRGLIVLSAGTYGNVIRLLVPLVATDSQITEGLDVLEASLKEVSKAAAAPIGDRNGPAW